MPSQLEKDFAQALYYAQHDLNRPWVYGAPVQQHHFDWCCEHQKVLHGVHPAHFVTPGPICHACAHGTLGLVLVNARHEFAKGRDWAFDFAWPALMVAVECEGIVRPRQGESVGRHQTADGFHKDLEKYGAAQERGWTVVRVSRRMVTSGEALRMTEVALKQAIGAAA